MDRSKRAIFKKAAIIIFWIGVWAAMAMAVDNPLLLVGPVPTAKALAIRLPEAEFWSTIFISMLRIGLGFVSGLALGLLLAGISAGVAFMEDLLKPVMTLLKAIPIASFAVLFLIWWGSSFLSVAVSFLVVLPNVYINTLEGIKSCDKKQLEMARVFRMSFRNRFFYIYIPALKPFLDSCLKLSLGMCWKSGVAAEVIGIPGFSIGERLYMAKISLDTAGVFAWTAVIILLSSSFERAALGLWNKFSVWEPAVREPGQRKRYGCRTGEINRDDGESAFHQVSFRYDDVSVISDYSDTFTKGGIYYFRTPSGTGKTTLLRLLAGLERPDSGWISGSDRCSMVFQEDRLLEQYSAVRNVELVTGAGQGAREQLLALLPPDVLDKPCRQLSGGMKRRVALVRAMSADSGQVLLDEPFTGLDPENKAAAARYIRKMQRERTVFIATHEEEEPGINNI